MSETTFNYDLLSGDATQLSSVALADPSGTWGVIRNDTGETVVAASTPMVMDSPGHYHYTFTDPAPGLVYTAYVARVYRGQSTSRQVIKSGGGDTLPRYLEVAQALAIAPSLLNVSAFLAATSQKQNAALSLATADINAMQFQGRKFDLLQVNQFPRVAYESSNRHAGYGPYGTGPLASNALPGGDVVWDWDAVNNVAITPMNVLIATLYQASNRLDGKQAAAFDQIYSALKSQKTGSLSETYDLSVQEMMAASGGSLTICRDAMLLLEPYRLRAGRLL